MGQIRSSGSLNDPELPIILKNIGLFANALSQWIEKTHNIIHEKQSRSAIQ